FSPEIRQVDPFEDLAFTTMGLRLEGQESLARNLALEYLHLYPDVAGYLLLDLYEIYRACVRLMVDSLQLSNLDSGSSDYSARKERLERRSRQYMNLVQDLMKGKKTSFGSTGPWPEPLIIVLMGLPATGKSLIARLLREDGIPVLSSDIIRKRRQSDLEKRKPSAFGEGIYSAHKKRRNYQHLLALGQKLMRAESRISLDASFSRKEYRNLLLEHCQKTGFAGSILFLETQCSEDVIRRRLNRRKEKGGTSDLTEFSTWKEIEKRFEKLDLNHGNNTRKAGQSSESQMQDYSFRCFHAVLDTSGEKREGSVLPEVRALLPDLFVRDDQ
ncbi:MAG TPA: hypothetical protein DEA96_18365, partial [Leptospiraceae bacterium]|nr:hypothetical protein [Leptospiraceae bacterium]